MASLAFAPTSVGAPQTAKRLPSTAASVGDDDEAGAAVRDRVSFKVVLSGFFAVALFLYAGSNGGALPVTGSEMVYFAEEDGGKPLSPTGKPLPKSKKPKKEYSKAEHEAEVRARKQAIKAKEETDLFHAKKTKKVDNKHVITHTEEVKVKHVDTGHHIKHVEENGHATHKTNQLSRAKEENAHVPVFTPATEVLDVDVEDGPQTEICTDASAGAVLGGVDVVAYRSLSPGANATMGSSEYTAYYGDYEFYFVDQVNRDAFAADPLKYAPKFGGFCSYGISDETFWTKSTLGPFANPNVWRVVDDRLLVFMYCTPEHKFFSQNITAQLDRGNKIWDTWWGDELVFNTQCFWESRMEGGAQDADSTKYDCIFD